MLFRVRGVTCLASPIDSCALGLNFFVQHCQLLLEFFRVRYCLRVLIEALSGRLQLFPAQLLGIGNLGEVLQKAL